MDKLIKYSIKHPISTIMYFIIITIISIVSIITIPMDFLPNIKEHDLLVSIIYPGMSAEQIKEVVTIQSENAFSSLKGIKEISSVSRDNCAFIKIKLHDNININTALIDSRQIIDQLEQTLPEDCLKPEVDILNSDKNSIIKVSLTSKEKNIPTLRELAENALKHNLQTIQGIGKIKVFGGCVEQIEVLYDIQKAQSLNLSPEIISESIINTNFEYPAGSIKDNNNEYTLKTSSIFKRIDDINNVLIPLEKTSVPLSEIATIKTTTSDKTSLAYENTNECILIDIHKKNNANPLLTASKIKSAIKNFQNEYPTINFKIINDSSIEIKKSIFSILISALISSLITYFVIYYFFRKKTISILLSIPIPLCIIFSILCLRIFGRSLNLFSLSGISIAIGMIVDPSIVIIENIILNNTKKNSDELIYNSIQQVKSSTINSSLTTIIVFTPFFFFSGNFGELFSDLSISVISSIIFSALISLTLLPSCYKIFLSKYKIQNINLNLVEHSTSIYKNSLTKILDKKNKFFLLISLISISLLFVPFSLLIKKEFSPITKSKNITFTLDFPANYSITKIEDEIKKILNSFTNNFPKCDINTTSGIEVNDYDKLADVFFNQNSVTFNIKLDSYKSKNAVTNFFKNKTFPIHEINSQDLITKALDINSIYIFSSQNKNDLKEFSKKYPDAIPALNVKEHIFTPNDQTLNYFNITKAEISNYLYYSLEGIQSGYFSKANKQIPIYVKPSSKISDLNQVHYFSNQKNIKLTSLGKITITENDKILYRYDRKDSKIILSPPKEQQNIISTSNQKLKEIIYSSILILLFVIILLYCLLGAQLESFKIPIILFLSIIPGFTGAMFALLITGNSLNINSLLSLIVLSGIAINNSIILLEALSEKNNLTKQQAITLLSKKVRPILITTITTILALLPFILIKDISPSQCSMSIALCGGLLFSVISSLVYIPFFIFKEQKWTKI